jgi:hypothetical protein
MRATARAATTDQPGAREGEISPEKLRARIHTVAELDDLTREAMWQLFTRYYAEVSRAAFFGDLDRKQHAIVLRTRSDGVLRGFSTLQVYQRVVQGRRLGVVFSGDTIVDGRFWGQTALQRAFFWFTLRHKLTHPHLPVFWFLISKGYKTYLLLARNFPEHWPRRDRPTPAWPRAVIDSLAQEKFGEDWDAGAGVVRFASCPGRLKGDAAPIDDEVRDRCPEARFFEAQNPGHASGDELCCLGRIGPRLWINFLARLAVKRVRSRGAA